MGLLEKLGVDVEIGNFECTFEEYVCSVIYGKMRVDLRYILSTKAKTKAEKNFGFGQVDVGAIVN